MADVPARHEFISDTLGLPGFPDGPEHSSNEGDHVMGVVVFAWLTEHATVRWGAEWARTGSLTVRFRRHLTAGVPLVTEVRGDGDSIDLRVINPDATELFATATAHAPDPRRRPSPAAMATPQVRPTSNSQPGGDDRTSDDGARGDLASRRFSPLTFEFNAARDLRFTQRLTHGAVWRDHGWAHPAWLASATNAIVWHNVDFATQETWANAGLAVHQLEPIADGSTITLTGGIRELFDGGRSRFAVAALTAWVDEVAVASLDNTFVYETLSSDEVRA